MGHAFEHQVHQHHRVDERAAVGDLVTTVDEPLERRSQDRAQRVIRGRAHRRTGQREPAMEDFVMARFVDGLLGGEVHRVDARRQPGKGTRDAQRGFLEHHEQGQVQAMHQGYRR